MDVRLTIAGVICLVLAGGHATIGLRWVLPGLTEERMPATAVGGRAMTLSMIRVTWHIVTIFALSLGGLLLTIAADAADTRTLMLRWFAAMWVAATAMAFWVSPPRWSSLRNPIRFPVPLMWLTVAGLCWASST